MSSFASPQSLKSALQSRVSVSQAERMGSQRQNLGEGMMCPAAAGDIRSDIYMRPVSQNTLLLNDAACSNYTEWSAQRRMMVENVERPQIPMCTAGTNGGDTMGVGRPYNPADLYGGGKEGDWVRHYSSRSNRPVEQPREGMAYYMKTIQPWTGSMDATQWPVRL